MSASTSRRERFLNADELRRFLDALESETALFHDFFMLLLLTGARRGNVQAMRFDELNLELRTWRISTTKNHEPLTVHLPEQAVEILKQRQRERDGNPWVFPGGKKNQQSHLKEPKSAWDRVCKRAKLSDVRIHDLRRTMGSWQAASGTSLHIIGKSLGHKTAAATRIYARLDLEPVRQAVDIAVAAMMAAAKETTSAVPK